MRSGRSSFRSLSGGGVRRPRARGAARRGPWTIFAIAAALVAQWPAAPEAVSAPLAAGSSGSTAPTATTVASCGRCGYQSDTGWRFCPACGWDLRALTGRAAAGRLGEIGRRTMGLVVVKEGPKLSDVIPPKVFERIRRFPWATLEPRRVKVFGTAFPTGRPGLYVTAARVLEHGVEAQLRSSSNRIVPAKIVAFDVPTGVGVLQTEGEVQEGLEVAAHSPAVHDPSWVVCYPIAATDELVRFLPLSFHRGRVTLTGAVGTYLVSFEDLLRTDHTIPDGCVGAPIVDRRGAMSGMVLDEYADGITYALPLAAMTPLVALLADQKAPTRPYFGLGLVAPDPRRRLKHGIATSESRPLVPYVIAGSPAAAAGIRSGDVLTTVAGRETPNVPAAGVALLGALPGSALRLGMLRNGDRVEVEVTPAERPFSVLLEPADEIQDALEINLDEVVSGPTSQMGLRVSHLVRGGRGEEQGFREGDVILAVNGKGVRRYETFNAIVRQANPHVFGGSRGGRQTDYPMYILQLDVRTAAGPKDGRDYLNLFPSLFAPPVY